MESLLEDDTMAVRVANEQARCPATNHGNPEGSQSVLGFLQRRHSQPDSDPSAIDATPRVKLEDDPAILAGVVDRTILVPLDL